MIKNWKQNYINFIYNITHKMNPYDYKFYMLNNNDKEQLLNLGIYNRVCVLK
jgi:hypothetical protein